MELRQLLESVDRSYPDFVDGVILYCEQDGIEQEIRDFISLHPEANSGDVARACYALTELRDEYPKLVYELIYTQY